MSDRFRRGYVECNNNYRLAEQVIARALGRKVYNGAEGLINIGTLPNDIYVLSSKKNKIIGKSSKNIYKVGDKVDIIIKKVDIFENISIFEFNNKSLNKNNGINK